MGEAKEAAREEKLVQSRGGFRLWSRSRRVSLKGAVISDGKSRIKSISTSTTPQDSHGKSMSPTIELVELVLSEVLDLPVLFNSIFTAKMGSSMTGTQHQPIHHG